MINNHMHHTPIKKITRLFVMLFYVLQKQIWQTEDTNYKEA